MTLLLALVGGGAPPPVTSTIAYTEGDDTWAASGTTTPPTFAGTIAFTEGDDTWSLAGIHTPPGGVVSGGARLAGYFAWPEYKPFIPEPESDEPPVSPIIGSIRITEDDDTVTAFGTASPPVTYVDADFETLLLVGAV